MHLYNQPTPSERSAKPGDAPTTLIARFVALSGHRETATQLLIHYANIVRMEPGCSQFQPYTDDSEPGAFIVLERYRDKEAFHAHLASEHNARFNAALAPHVQGPSVLQFLTTLTRDTQDSSSADSKASLQKISR